MQKETNILLSMILLLYKSSQSNADNSSLDLIEDTVELMSKGKRGYDDGDEIRSSLITYILSILTEPQELTTVLITVRDIVNDDMYVIFSNGIETVYANEGLLMDAITKLRNFITEYFIGRKAQNLFSRASMTLKSSRDDIRSSREYVQEVINELESLAMHKSGSVDGITETIDLNLDGLTTVVDAMKEESKGGNVYRLGWQQLNETFQGGVRPGEYYNISALSHNNKTGIFDTNITALAYYNKPINVTEGKKPTILVFKTEDALSKTFAYMFKVLKMTEEGINPEVKDFTAKEIKEYLSSRLLRNGWHIIFHSTDSSELTYRSVMKRVFDLEAQGHEVKICGIDYLTKMSTVGCNHGPHGNDKRDLVKRLMTFFKARDCLIMSPSQTNTSANNLLEDGIEPYELPKVIAERGMYADSRQLHQEFDLSTQQQKFIKGGRAFLAIMREKHRTAPEILEESKKYLILPFPLKGPIPMDLDKDKPIGFRSIERLNQSLSASNNKIT